jgi:hypothetical protein
MRSRLAPDSRSAYSHEIVQPCFAANNELAEILDEHDVRAVRICLRIEDPAPIGRN